MNLLITLLFVVNADALANKSKNTRAAMNKALESYAELTPYLMNETKFIDPQNEEKIFFHINQLTHNFAGMHGHKRLQGPNFSSTLKVIDGHLKESRAAFQSQHKFFARNRLRATSELCISCHTQMKHKASGAVLMSLNKQLKRSKSSFEKAETYLLIRDYGRSFESYKTYVVEELAKRKKIKGYQLPESKNLTMALRRIVYLKTKVSFEPLILESYLSKILPELEEKGLRFLSKEVAQWIVQVKPWIALNNLDKYTSIKSFVDKFLYPIEKAGMIIGSGEYDITLLIASGKILELIEKNKDSGDIPLGLYWMAVADRQLNFSYYFSISEVYLSECMEKYSKNPIALKCLDEYKRSMNEGYSGSSGLKLPKDVQDKIKKYEQLLSK